jgi:hypothetical protein
MTEQLPVVEGMPTSARMPPQQVSRTGLVPFEIEYESQIPRGIVSEVIQRRDERSSIATQFAFDQRKDVLTGVSSDVRRLRGSMTDILQDRKLDQSQEWRRESIFKLERPVASRDIGRELTSERATGMGFAFVQDTRRDSAFRQTTDITQRQDIRQTTDTYRRKRDTVIETPPPPRLPQGFGYAGGGVSGQGFAPRSLERWQRTNPVADIPYLSRGLAGPFAGKARTTTAKRRKKSKR